MGVQHQEACPDDGGDRRGTTRASQRRNLSKEVAGTQADALMLQLDLHLAGGYEIHRMRRLAAPRQHLTGLDLPRAQQPHDVGDFRSVEL